MRQTIRHILYAVALAILTAGCSSWIKDDLSDCPQEMVFHFYRQTPCETQPYYPADIREVRVFAFNEHNVLTAQYDASALTLRGDYRLTTHFDHQGDFTFVAWGAESFDGYDLSSVEPGVTTRQQLALTLARQADAIAQPKPLYFSQQTNPVARHYQPEEGTHRDSVGLNLQQLTNRIFLTVYGLDPAHDYHIYISDNNDQYDFGGRIVEGRPAFEYTSPQDRNGGIYRCRFTTLKMEEKRGTRLVVYDKTLGQEAFGALLVDDLIMYRGIFGEPPYSLDCDHDFNVIVWLERNTAVVGTYMAVQVTVNDWNVVKRNATPHARRENS